jgi:hypothetical protein
MRFYLIRLTGDQLSWLLREMLSGLTEANYVVNGPLSQGEDVTCRAVAERDLRVAEEILDAINSGLAAPVHPGPIATDD